MSLPILRSLHNQKFAWLLSGQTLSRIGDFLFQVALAWWVLEKTGSAVAMGTVMIFTMTPMILFVLVGGVVVDRLPRARLLFLSDLGRGLIMTVGAWLVFSDRLEIWGVYIIALSFGLADAFFMPAYSALIQQMIPQDDLPSANSLNSLSMQFGRIAGPALGGILTGLGGVALSFGFNALSFLLGALTVIPLLSLAVPDRASEADPAPRHLLADLREGLQAILASPILWITILVAAFVNITLSGPFSIALPFLVRDFLGGDEKLLGLLYSIFPIGYILGSLWMGSRARLRWRGISFYVASAVAGLGLAFFGLRLPLSVIIIAAIANGAALEIVGLIWTNLLQELVPPEKMGRVSSIDMLGSFVLLPIGYALTGWLVDRVGPAPVFLFAGSLAALVSLTTLFHPRIRSVD